jgi:hypothetical protein
MNNVKNVLVKMGLLSLLSVMPLAAQMMDDGVNFTAPSPFYAGDVKLPAGNYRVVQPNPDADVLQIENRDDLGSVFVDFEPTESTQPHRNSAVTFEKYGDTDYLDRVWIEGQEYGTKVDPGRVETAAEANATPRATTAGGQ